MDAFKYALATLVGWVRPAFAAPTAWKARLGARRVSGLAIVYGAAQGLAAANAVHCFKDGDVAFGIIHLALCFYFARQVLRHYDDGTTPGAVTAFAPPAPVPTPPAAGHAWVGDRVTVADGFHIALQFHDVADARALLESLHRVAPSTASIVEVKSAAARLARAAASPEDLDEAAEMIVSLGELVDDPNVWEAQLAVVDLANPDLHALVIEKIVRMAIESTGVLPRVCSWTWAIRDDFDRRVLGVEPGTPA